MFSLFSLAIELEQILFSPKRIKVDKSNPSLNGTEI
jgi:hypothetical protein